MTLGKDFVYPEPRIKWYPNAEQHPSLVLDACNRGLHALAQKAAPQPVPVKVSASPSAKESSKEIMVVELQTAFDLEVPMQGHKGLRATAFYQSEGFEYREKRKTDLQRSRLSQSGQGLEDCDFNWKFNVPYNSREQFVKVGILVVDAEGTEVSVGEATIPVADPSVEELQAWRLVRDFEERGQVKLRVGLPGSQLAVAASVTVTSAVAETSTSLLPLSENVEAPSVSESLGSMIPAPLSTPQSSLDSPACVLESSRLQLLTRISEGDAVQVFSKTAGAWVQAAVQLVDRIKGVVVVTHSGTVRTIDLHSPDLEENFRLLSAAEKCTQTAAVSCNGYVLGDVVEVFSKSAGSWVSGTITRLDPHRKELTVEYGDRARSVSLEDEHIQAYFRCPAKSNQKEGQLETQQAKHDARQTDLPASPQLPPPGPQASPGQLFTHIFLQGPSQVSTSSSASPQSTPASSNLISTGSAPLTPQLFGVGPPSAPFGGYQAPAWNGKFLTPQAAQNQIPNIKPQLLQAQTQVAPPHHQQQAQHYIQEQQFYVHQPQQQPHSNQQQPQPNQQPQLQLSSANPPTIIQLPLQNRVVLNVGQHSPVCQFEEIQLPRAQGIPAHLVQGFVYR